MNQVRLPYYRLTFILFALLALVIALSAVSGLNYSRRSADNIYTYANASENHAAASATDATARLHTYSSAAAGAPPTWRDTGIRVPWTEGALCADPVQPYTVDVGARDRGTITLDWLTGSGRLLNTHVVDLCSSSGWLYASDNMGIGPSYRFNLQSPREQPIGYVPDAAGAGQDGLQYVYSLRKDQNQDWGKSLWVSSDAGITWTQRNPPFAGVLRYLLVAATDARVVYGFTSTDVSDPYPTSQPEATQVATPVPGTIQYSIYASTDAGATWERRSSETVPLSLSGERHLSLGMVPGPTAPVDLLTLEIDTANAYSADVEVLISSDGGRTFSSLGTTHGPLSQQIVHTQEGIVRMVQTEMYDRNPVVTNQSLQLSTDKGKTWQPLPPPPPLPTFVAGATSPGPEYLEVAPAAPSNLFLNSGQYRGPLKYSPDGGHTWQQVENGSDSRYYYTEYLPLSVLGIKSFPEQPGQPIPTAIVPIPTETIAADPTWAAMQNHNNHLFVLDLPDAGKYQTARAPASNAPGSLYFEATGHNIPQVFRAYWEQHGGLAQFGYPRTEPFLEVNRADGKSYLTQYFERNRFEHHPEYAGTSSEVELGLLGAEQTTSRRATGDAGELPFCPTADARYADGTYFAATSHNLRGTFKAYWEAHGGLAIYGYPISEEFTEKSTTDGKSYLVQYFERNRFEYHPENKGTQYEVLLGLLGNDLLLEKGWLK